MAYQVVFDFINQFPPGVLFAAFLAAGFAIMAGLGMFRRCAK